MTTCRRNKLFNTGEGGSGVCVLVQDRIRKVNQVMKIQFLEDREGIKNFKKEVRMMSKLSSPHVVRIEDGDFLYLPKRLGYFKFMYTLSSFMQDCTKGLAHTASTLWNSVLMHPWRNGSRKLLQKVCR